MRARHPLLVAHFSIPPFANPQQESEHIIVTGAAEKALRPRMLEPGYASAGWLYFPVPGRRAAEEAPRHSP
jgi:hypothetical protein